MIATENQRIGLSVRTDGENLILEDLQMPVPKDWLPITRQLAEKGESRVDVEADGSWLFLFSSRPPPFHRCRGNICKENRHLINWTRQPADWGLIVLKLRTASMTG